MWKTLSSRKITYTFVAMKKPAQQIYLDHNATTPPLPEVVEAVCEALRTAYGNPSSGHRQGEPARRLLQRARETLQGYLGTPDEQFVFTGSGTEANNLALRSLARHGSCIITNAIEHSSILNCATRLQAEGSPTEIITATAEGEVDLCVLRQQLMAHRHAAVSIQWINNETGIIQPVREITSLAREHGALLHIDAAQAVGKIDTNIIEELDPDFLSLTAHKFNGPAGVGALYARQPALIDPLCVGGGQQGGWHAGTENTAGIAGLQRALELRYSQHHEAMAHMAELRDIFEKTVLDRCSWVRINGNRDKRVCNTSNLCFEGIDGQALVGRLDTLGIYCSQSSACTTGRPEPSHVLRAMGLSEAQAYASVRFSFGVTNTHQEAELAATIVATEAEHLKRIFA
ncbi:cysteine desulfurase family protein [Halomonas sp. LR5S13]|uniref:cysteine desulfurase family protein n=1 Tax=Halomonas rhizosphaerae TaxID=3043296 RepID=UPI0024A9BC4E|nr:cysteine desulfurase family protein [Halomonas rhizosphaerae]MDI5922703.1 cysteine desulfurase family protein [Halomonas rhizosphaerae]